MELAIRTAVTRLGGGMLERLLAADPGYRGPGTDCGAGHQAEFVSYRDKTIDTVLGPVTVSRAWYHCGQCGHGLAPRDAELGTAGQTMSPGLRKMSARAAGAVPFTPGAGLVAALAGITLTGKRLGRHAEADGRAAAAVIEAGAAAIKVFPARAFGPAYFKDLREPLPQLKLMPTGGVSLDNAGEYIKNGAIAVGNVQCPLVADFLIPHCEFEGTDLPGCSPLAPGPQLT